MNKVNLGIALAQLILPAAAGLLGVAVGGWITASNQRQERRYGHLKEQLQKFYAPLLSMRMEIKAKSELRKTLREKARARWQVNPGVSVEVENARQAQYEKFFDYDEDQLRNELIPLYQQMLEHVKANMWLAEPSTLEHFDALVEFVEIWNRFLAKAMPYEMLELIDHKESALFPFYDDLQSQADKLREQLAN